MKKLFTLFTPLLVLTLLSACSLNSTVSSASRSGEDAKQKIQVLMNNIESAVNEGDFEKFTAFFSDDAIIMGDDSPDVIGLENIRNLYAEAMEQTALFVDFKTSEIRLAGDLAYEQGSYILRVSDKESGEVLSETESRHVHIFQRQADGEWRTWRMFVNNYAP